MYNRYIPQPDGSFRRNKMPDMAATPNPPPPVPPPQEEEGPVFHPATAPVPRQGSAGIGQFFRQLLPKNLETADLLILLLLLLMAGDNEEERSNALLTMALYFFM